ncbi:hypothetical protein YC2023_022769 [Brassica napus]
MDTRKIHELGFASFKSLPEMFDDCIRSFQEKRLNYKTDLGQLTHMILHWFHRLQFKAFANDPSGGFQLDMKVVEVVL